MLEMARLKSAVPEKVRELLEGVMESEEAWEKLDDRYGDRKVAIIVAITDLTNLELPAGLAHEKIEAIVQGVRVAKVRLRAVAGDAELFADWFPVGSLVKKLKQEIRTRWRHHRAKLPEGAQHDGFEAWLELERRGQRYRCRTPWQDVTT